MRLYIDNEMDKPIEIDRYERKLIALDTDLMYVLECQADGQYSSNNIDFLALKLNTNINNVKIYSDEFCAVNTPDCVIVLDTVNENANESGRHFYAKFNVFKPGTTFTQMSDDDDLSQGGMGY